MPLLVRRPLIAACVFAMVLASFTTSFGPLRPSRSGYAAAAAQSDGGISLTSSVVVRPNDEISIASDDPNAYLADRYLVSFHDDVRDPVATTDALGAQLGFAASHIYQAHMKGFAAKLTPEVVTALGADPRVARVTPDVLIPSSAAPTGVRRIGTQLNTTAKLDDIDGSGQRVNADVAVIDSGIDLYHPDLNVEGGADCTGGNNPYFDEAGHGTHIAGTIGALDDGVGVVGVAPGVRLWSIKVSVQSGAYLSWYLCGLATLADNADIIEVANISLAATGSDGSCASSDEHQLICDAVAGGVTIAVAAGNYSSDAKNFLPATYSQVITVSALADSDGKIGGKGPSTRAGADDRFASFSNFGADVDLAAPGVDILSTWPTNLESNYAYGLGVASGTSMAAPHVAGAAALYIAKNGRVGSSAVKAALQKNSDAASLSGDPDGVHEPVLYVGAIAPACTLSPTSGKRDATVTATCTKFRANETVYLHWDSTSATKSASFVASNSGSGSTTFKIPLATKGSHTVISLGRTSGKKTTDTVSVTSGLTLSPKSGAAGTSVKVTLTGFAKGETISVKWYKSASSTTTLKSGIVASSTGSANLTVTIPSGTSGSHKVEATGSAGNKASATFTLTSSVQSADVKTATSEITPTTAPTERPTETPGPTQTAPPTEESAEQADLTILDAVVQPGTDVTTRESVTVQVEIANDGFAASGRDGFSVCASIEGIESVEKVTRRGLGNGDGARISLRLGRLPVGTHELQVQVDCQDEVAEADESNNLFGPVTIVVTAPGRDAREGDAETGA